MAHSDGQKVIILEEQPMVEKEDLESALRSDTVNTVSGARFLLC